VRDIFRFACTSIMCNLDLEHFFLDFMPMCEHFMTILSNKCNINLGHVIASGWGFLENSCMLLLTLL
jgi:hypothetical protein